MNAARMSLRSALMLIIAVGSAVSAAGPVRAQGSHLFSAMRVAEIKDRGAGAFKGNRRTLRAPLFVPPRNLDSADSFRTDELPIWSSTSQSKWHLLPPKLLGTAATTDVVEVR